MTREQTQQIFDLTKLIETLTALENTINPTLCEANLKNQTEQLIKYVKSLQERE